MTTPDALEVMEEIITEEPIRNFNHDLVQVLSEKLDGVVRYDVYHEDAEGECEHCTRLWEQIKGDDTRHVQLLRDEIIRHCQQGIFQ